MLWKIVLTHALVAILLGFSCNAQIIGSSVVTSVSVVLGNDVVTVPSVSTVPPPPVSTSSGKVVMLIQNVTDPGVLSVIATLKNIVEEEHQKQQTEKDASSDSHKALEAPTLFTSTPPEVDDDEAEAEEEIHSSTAVNPKPIPTEFPTSMVVKTFETSPEVEPLENDTATSAEVHQAIHRISGALLKPGKKPVKPIENILTDVLKTMQEKRNVSSEAGAEHSGVPPSSTPPTNPMPSEPEIGAMVVGSKGHIPALGSQSEDELSVERETEEELSSMAEVTTSQPPRPKTTKNPLQYLTKPSKKNVSAVLKRPTEFYDDEIFGYDPYQTFLHGVYVPQNDELAEDSVKAPPGGDVPHHYHVANMKPQRPPFPQHLRQPIINQLAANKRKPVPTLPDHLHRPRPSHLQYQHTAADTIDTESGLTAIKVQHPGQKFTNHKQNLEADRLGSMSKYPPAAPIPRTTVAPTLPMLIQHSTSRPTPPTFPTTLAPKVSTQRLPVLAHSPPPLKVDHGHPSGSHGVKETPAANAVNNAPSDRRPFLSKAPPGNPGLEGTITHLDKEMKTFVDICNRLGLRFFSGVTNPVGKATTDRNVVMSPFTVISSLGLLFLGARGSTATQLDSLLTLDDQMTFNPHLMYHNITQSFLSQSNTAAAIIRLLIADKNKGDVLDFYKMRVQHFYDARVEEVDYKYAGHLATSIINQMIRAQIQRHSYEMLNGSLPLSGPLTLLTSTFFDGQFGGTRDPYTDSLEFIHLTDMGRQVIQVEAVALKGPFRAAYEETLDVTAVDLPYNTRDLSLILLLPGKSGEYPLGGLEALKTKLNIESWTALMRSFMARDKFKVVLPRFRHHTALNLSQVTQRFGLTDMFRPDLAKFQGVNGLTDLYLDQNLMHFAELSTHEKLSDTLSEAANQKTETMKILRPHVRGEPLSINDWIFLSRTPAKAPLPRTSQAVEQKPKSSLPAITYTRIRSGKVGVVAEPFPAEEKVIRFERPFLYVLRHNPTGFLLMMGQYVEPAGNNNYN